MQPLPQDHEVDTGAKDPQELDILRSWHLNAAAWSRAIRSAAILSRERVTNAAILGAVGTPGGGWANWPRLERPIGKTP